MNKLFSKKRLLRIVCSTKKYGQGEEEKGKVRQEEQTALHAQWACAVLTNSLCSTNSQLSSFAKKYKALPVK